MVGDNGNDAGDPHVDDCDDNERYAVMIFLPSGQIILISEARRTTRRALKQMASFIVINHDNHRHHHNCHHNHHHQKTMTIKTTAI